MFWLYRKDVTNKHNVVCCQFRDYRILIALKIFLLSNWDLLCVKYILPLRLMIFFMNFS